MGQLSATRVKQLSNPGLISDGDNLYLNVSKSGSKSWVFRYRHGGKRKAMGLGSAKVVSLVEARELALAHNKTLAQGQDPQIVRNAAAQRLPVTLDMAVKKSWERYCRGKGEPSPKQYQSWWGPYLNHVKKALGERAVKDITLRDLEDVLLPKWGTKGDIGYKCYIRIKGAYEWMLTLVGNHGYDIDGVDLNMPRRLLLTMPDLRHDEAKKPSIGWQDVPRAYAMLAQMDGPAALAHRFYMLSVTRVANAVSARKEWIDLNDRVLRIPRNEMKHKTGDAHVVPLSDEHMAVLAEAEAYNHGSDLIFPSMHARKNVTVSANTFSKWLRENGFKDYADGRPATAHGLRRTFGHLGQSEPPARVRTVAQSCTGPHNRYWRDPALRRPSG